MSGSCCLGKKNHEINGYQKKLSEFYSFIFEGLLTSIGILSIYFIIKQKDLQFWVWALTYAVFSRIVWIKVIQDFKSGSFFSENVLMSIAAIAAFFLKEYIEGLAILFFYRLGEIFISYAENKSARSIEKLMSLKPSFARVKKNNDWVNVPIDNIKKGDIYQLRIGDRNGVDAVILKGSGTLDKSIISGESMPSFVKKGQKVLSGMLLQQGNLELMALKPASQSSFERIITLAKTSQKHKGQAERFIRTFARYYTPLIITMSCLMAVIIPILTQISLQESIIRALVLIVIACPCALIISIPLSYFSAIGRASQLGLIFKGGQYISKYAKVKHFVFDKTGTLTLGTLSVKNIYCFKGNKDELLYLATQAGKYSSHPMSKTLMDYSKKLNIPIETCDNVKENSGLGISCNFKNKQLLLGKKSWIKNNNIRVPTPEEMISDSSVYIAYDGYCKGMITFADTIRPSSLALIDALKKENINISILSGDTPEAVESVSQALDIKDYHSNLLPEEKLSILSQYIKKSKNCVTYVGDGINDLPSISKADVGIAIGEGSDSVLEMADVVLLGGNSYTLYKGLQLSRKTQRIVWQNIIFAIGIKCLFLGLGIIGFSKIWMAIFADTGVTILTILNAFRLFQKIRT